MVRPWHRRRPKICLYRVQPCLQTQSRLLPKVPSPSHLEAFETSPPTTQARRVKRKEKDLKFSNWYILLVAIKVARPTMRNSHTRVDRAHECISRRAERAKRASTQRNNQPLPSNPRQHENSEEKREEKITTAPGKRHRNRRSSMQSSDNGVVFLVFVTTLYFGNGTLIVGLSSIA